jgi:hypothetical protein
METNIEEFLKDYSIIREVENGGIKIIIVKEIKKGTAQQRYYEKNKDKINSYKKEWKREKYQNNEEFREKSKECRRKCYEKKKKDESVKE